MTSRIHPEAEAEARAAAAWYESRSAGLGFDFTDEYDRAVRAILAQPRLHPPADDTPPGVETRDLLLARFAYRVVYVILDDELTIVAVAHTRRRPGYWHRRLNAPP